MCVVYNFNVKQLQFTVTHRGGNMTHRIQQTEQKSDFSTVYTMTCRAISP